MAFRRIRRSKGVGGATGVDGSLLKKEIARVTGKASFNSNDLHFRDSDTALSAYKEGKVTMGQLIDVAHSLNLVDRDSKDDITPKQALALLEDSSGDVYDEVIKEATEPVKKTKTSRRQSGSPGRRRVKKVKRLVAVDNMTGNNRGEAKRTIEEDGIEKETVMSETGIEVPAEGKEAPPEPVAEVDELKEEFQELKEEADEEGSVDVVVNFDDMSSEELASLEEFIKDVDDKKEVEIDEVPETNPLEITKEFSGSSPETEAREMMVAEKTALYKLPFQVGDAVENYGMGSGSPLVVTNIDYSDELVSFEDDSKNVFKLDFAEAGTLTVLNSPQREVEVGDVVEAQNKKEQVTAQKMDKRIAQLARLFMQKLTERGMNANVAQKEIHQRNKQIGKWLNSGWTVDTIADQLNTDYKMGLTQEITLDSGGVPQHPQEQEEHAYFAHKKTAEHRSIRKAQRLLEIGDKIKFIEWCKEAWTSPRRGREDEEFVAYMNLIKRGDVGEIKDIEWLYDGTSIDVSFDVKNSQRRDGLWTLCNDPSHREFEPFDPPDATEAPYDPQLTASKRIAKIVKRKNEYCVVADSGRNMGCYKSKEKAENRLKQVEKFKHMRKKKGEGKSMDFKANFVEHPKEKNLSYWVVSDKGKGSVFAVTAKHAFGNDILPQWELFKSPVYGRKLVAELNKKGVKGVLDEWFDGGKSAYMFEKKGQVAPEDSKVPSLEEENAQIDELPTNEQELIPANVDSEVADEILEPKEDESDITELVSDVLAPVIKTLENLSPEDVVDELANTFGDETAKSEFLGKLKEKVETAEEGEGTDVKEKEEDEVEVIEKGVSPGQFEGSEEKVKLEEELKSVTSKLKSVTSKLDKTERHNKTLLSERSKRMRTTRARRLAQWIKDLELENKPEDKIVEDLLTLSNGDFLKKEADTKKFHTKLAKRIANVDKEPVMDKKGLFAAGTIGAQVNESKDVNLTGERGENKSRFIWDRPSST